MIQLLFTLAAFLQQDTVPQPLQAEAESGRRVMSIDLCADQFVLAMVDRSDIVSVSRDATKDVSLMRERAEGLRVSRPELESILLSEPTIVVRSYGGDASMLRRLSDFDIEVVQVPYAQNMEAVTEAIQTVGYALGEKITAAELSNKVQLLTTGERSEAERQRAIYLTPSGVTTGPGSLIHEVIEAGGYSNFITTPGWRDVDLEQLTTEKPDLVIRGFFDTDQSFKGGWSIGRHPQLTKLIADIPYVDIPGATLSCSTWALADAVHAIRDASRRE
ncbi:MAG: ABC transporter substrate-binding protein [Pseudomonadota bacterium]